MLLDFTKKSTGSQAVRFEATAAVRLHVCAEATQNTLNRVLSLSCKKKCHLTTRMQFETDVCLTHKGLAGFVYVGSTRLHRIFFRRRKLLTNSGETWDSIRVQAVISMLVVIDETQKNRIRRMALAGRQPTDYTRCFERKSLSEIVQG